MMHLTSAERAQLLLNHARVARSDFPRPLGVPGDVQRVGDVPRDLSVRAQTAAEDLRNALTIIGPLDDSLIREALQRLIGRALAKIELEAA